MFTGIVEEIGAVRSGGAAFEIACTTVLDQTRIGDSISVNGCCVTVTTLPAGGFTADLMGETLARTGLGGLLAGAPVNLERALRADSRLGGHLVQGHVDATAVVRDIVEHTDWRVMTLSLPPSLASFVVEKGSITIDGVSLTVMAVDDTSFAVGLIPHTLAVTALGSRTIGDTVNLEGDVIAKYVGRLLQGGAATPYRKET